MRLEDQLDSGRGRGREGQYMSIRILRVRGQVAPVTWLKWAQLEGPRLEGAPMVRVRVVDEEVQLCPRYATRLAGMAQLGSEEADNAVFGHEAEDASVSQHELGHSWDVEDRRAVQDGGVEGDARSLIADVEDEVRSLHRDLRYGQQGGLAAKGEGITPDDEGSRSVKCRRQAPTRVRLRADRRGPCRRSLVTISRGWSRWACGDEMAVKEGGQVHELVEPRGLPNIAPALTGRARNPVKRPA